MPFLFKETEVDIVSCYPAFLNHLCHSCMPFLAVMCFGFHSASDPSSQGCDWLHFTNPDKKPAISGSLRNSRKSLPMISSCGNMYVCLSLSDQDKLRYPVLYKFLWGLPEGILHRLVWILVGFCIFLPCLFIIMISSKSTLEKSTWTYTLLLRPSSESQTLAGIV